MLAGLSLVVASACVFNNLIDRDIDRRMARTKSRALVSGRISAPAAIVYASLLGAAGVLVLILWTNLLTTLIALAAEVVYVIFYGWAKRRSVHSTVVGSLAGAAPPAIGYCSLTNHLDGAALILFLILVFWQMPHFYAIGIYRRDDYAAAKLPILPVKSGLKATKINILAYITAFIAAVASLTIFGYSGYSYLIITGLAGLAWLRLGLKGLNSKDDKPWARQMFRFSLLVTLIVSLMISLDTWLP